MRIGEIAELLRCQVHREEDAEGKIRELAPEDFRSVAGLARFSPKEAKTRVRVDIGSRSSKFILQENDILLRTISGIETVGETFLMTATPRIPTIPVKSLVILRPDTRKVEPIWLFYRLSQGDVREHLRRNVTGTRPGYVRNDAIKAFELNEPTEKAIKASNLTHKRFLEHLWTLEKFQDEERESWANLGKLLARYAN